MTAPVNIDAASVRLACALDYAGRGWPVVPLNWIQDGRCSCGTVDCPSPCKHPLSPNGLKDASTDPGTIRGWLTRWPDANLGIATGAASGLLVIDVDPRHGGDVALDDLLAVHGPLPETVEALTGGGGRHIYFKDGSGTVRNSAGKLGPGLDVRGTGGYVVCPPSDHISGRRYAWELSSDPGEVPVAEAPPWLLALLQEAPPVASATQDGRIGQGKRNDTLARLAGAMRRRGMSESAILAALVEENRTRCDPPLSDSEVAGIAKSIGRYTPAGGGRVRACNFNRTDSGNAELLAHLYGDRLRFDHRRGRLLLWRDHSWHDDVDGEIDRMVLEAARVRFHAAADVADSAEKTAQARWAINSESRQRREAALALVRSVHPVADAGENWDTDPWLVGVANGVVDLRSRKLRDGRPKDRITLALSWPYRPDARAERWERFISEIFGGNDDLIDFIHRAVGYSLTGLTTEQCLFVCYGGGANGKSVFLQTLRTVLGPLAVNTAFATLEFTGRGAASNDLAALADRRLVTASETNEGARLNEARVKALTGGDTLTARFLYREFFQFKPTCKVWLAVNHRPRVTDDSEAFWRRVRLVPFTRQFRGADADPNLADTLHAEAEGILAWLVRGALAWRQRGLEAPECVRTATDDYRIDSDVLGDFLAERCDQGPDYTATPAEISKAYGLWADGLNLSKHERLSTTALGRKLGDRFAKDRTGRQRFYRGLRVRL
jgi:putative DNA primase/helicase